MLYQYRKYIAIGLILLIIGGIIWAVVAYFSNFQKVTITYDKSDVKSLELYAAFESKGVLTLDGDKIQDIQSGEQYSLAKGLYALKPAGDRIKTDLLRLDVGELAVTQTLDIDYTSAYLESLLETEQASITTALYESNPKIEQLYTLNAGTLYKKGEWFGTTLSYKGTETLSRDTLRTILHKKDGVWVVVAKPAITLPIPSYKDIPASVVKAVNAVDIGLPLMPGMQPDPIYDYPRGGENE